MSAYCDSDSQACLQGCCNALTKCPSSPSGCFYYYDGRENTPGYDPTATLTAGAIAGIIVGSLFFVVIIVTLCLWWRGRKREQTIPTTDVTHNTLGVTTATIPSLDLRGGKKVDSDNWDKILN